MMSVENVIITYQDLADREDRQGSPQLRDRFLLLAADAAQAAGEVSVAEGLRERLLEANPHHMIKPYPSFEEALRAPDFHSYLADLRAQYPPEEAARLLAEELPAAARLSTGPATSSEPLVEPEPIADFYSHQPEPQPAPAKGPLTPAVTTIPIKAEPRREKPAYTYQADKPAAPVAAPPAPQPPVDEDDPGSRLSWLVASFLFLVVLLAGMTAAGYTLLRPFLPL